MRPYAWNVENIKESPFMRGSMGVKEALAKAKQAEKDYKQGASIGFTYVSSLKAMGRIPRSDGIYKKSEKYN